jgi:hypothetical protein
MEANLIVLDELASSLLQPAYASSLSEDSLATVELYIKLLGSVQDHSRAAKLAEILIDFMYKISEFHTNEYL